MRKKGLLNFIRNLCRLDRLKCYMSLVGHQHGICYWHSNIVSLMWFICLKRNNLSFVWNLEASWILICVISVSGWFVFEVSGAKTSLLNTWHIPTAGVGIKMWNRISWLAFQNINSELYLLKYNSFKIYFLRFSIYQTLF